MDRERSLAVEESSQLCGSSLLASRKPQTARVKGTKKRDREGILCYRCRRSGSTMSQRSIMAFCRGVPSAERTGGSAPAEAAADQPDSAILVCRQCRRPMEESAPVSNANSRIAMTRTCPSITKLRGYKRVAAEKKIDWRILESDAQRIMSLPCAFCGRLARDNPGGFNGINRVNHSLQVYDHDNVAPACSDCNTMKHDYSSRDFVQICRHVATFQGLGNFSLFPEVFRNASSRRGRRSIICLSCSPCRAMFCSREYLITRFLRQFLLDEVQDARALERGVRTYHSPALPLLRQADGARPPLQRSRSSRL
jgi:hypothetical protein